MYLISWNVAGWSTTSQAIREHYGSLANFFHMTKADVICIQESKISRERLRQAPESAGAADPPSGKVFVPPVGYSSSFPLPAAATSSSSTTCTARKSTHSHNNNGGGGPSTIPGWESFWAHSGKQHRGMNGVTTFVKYGLAEMCDNHPFLPCDIMEEEEIEKERTEENEVEKKERTETDTEKEEVGRRKQALVDQIHEEGRCVVVYLSSVIIVNVYVPNARGGARLRFKMQFLYAVQSLLSRLRSGTVRTPSSSSSSSSSTSSCSKHYVHPRPVILVGDLNLTYRAQDAAWWFRRLDLGLLEALEVAMQEKKRCNTPTIQNVQDNGSERDGDGREGEGENRKKKEEVETRKDVPCSTFATLSPLSLPPLDPAAALKLLQEHVTFHFPPTAPFFSSPSASSSSHWLSPEILPLLLSPASLEIFILSLKQFLCQEVFVVLAWLKHHHHKKVEEHEKKQEKKKNVHLFSSLSSSPSSQESSLSGGLTCTGEDGRIPYGDRHADTTTSSGRGNDASTSSNSSSSSSTEVVALEEARQDSLQLLDQSPAIMRKKKGGEVQVMGFPSGDAAPLLLPHSPLLARRSARPPSIALDSNLAATPHVFPSSCGSSPPPPSPRIPYDHPSQFSLFHLEALAEYLATAYSSLQAASTPILPPLSSSPPFTSLSSSLLSSASFLYSIPLSRFVAAGMTSVAVADFLHGCHASSSTVSPSSSAWNHRVVYPLSKLVSLPPHADVSMAYMRSLLPLNPSSSPDSSGILPRSTRGNLPPPPPPLHERMWDSFFIPPLSSSLSASFLSSSTENTNGGVGHVPYYYPYCPTPFTCWDQQRNRRQSNEGTRLDYILLDAALLPFVLPRGHTENNTGRPPLMVGNLDSAPHCQHLHSCSARTLTIATTTNTKNTSPTTTTGSSRRTCRTATMTTSASIDVVGGGKGEENIKKDQKTEEEGRKEEKRGRGGCPNRTSRNKGNTLEEEESLSTRKRPRDFSTSAQLHTMKESGEEEQMPAFSTNHHGNKNEKEDEDKEDGGSTVGISSPVYDTLPRHVRDFFFGEFLHSSPHYKDGIRRATAGGAYPPAPYGGGGMPPLPLSARAYMWGGLPSTGLLGTPPQYSDHIGVGVVLREEPQNEEETHPQHDVVSSSSSFSLRPRPAGVQVLDLHPPCAYKPPRTLFSFFPSGESSGGERRETGGRGGDKEVT